MSFTPHKQPGSSGLTPDAPDIERRCPACPDSVTREVGSKGGFALRQCRSCRTLFTATWPTWLDLAALYDHYYDHGNFSLPPAAEATLDRLVRSCAPYRSTGRWLDVGFGAGGLLSVAERHGWHCHGTEVSPPALEFGKKRGWIVSCDTASDSRFPPGGFDVVTMLELIEHVTEPIEVLSSAARWLRPGGVLYLTTPNIGSLNYRVLGAGWSVVVPPEHLTIWSGLGVRRVLSAAGFTRMQVRTEGLNPTEFRARFRSPRSSLPPANHAQERQNLNEALSRDPLRRGLKTAINQGLSIVGIGDSLKVRAVLGRSHTP